MTHAFFKALLFLAAGAVIIAMHHEQDMRKMGGLRQRMPVTYWTALIGALALIGTPFFSGFYSKDALIDAVHASQRYGAGYAYWCVLLGVFVTALYTFRMIFMTFHGPERLDHHAQEHFHDVGWDMKAPLVALAIPSLIIGYLTVEPMLFGGYFGSAIQRAARATMWSAELGARVARAGGVRAARACCRRRRGWRRSACSTAWWFVLKRPQLRRCGCASASAALYRLLVNKYYFDWFNENVLAPLARGIGHRCCGAAAIRRVIDGALVNGSAQAGRLARRCDPAAAERISVLVCLLDDHRPGGVCWAGS